MTHLNKKSGQGILGIRFRWIVFLVAFTLVLLAGLMLLLAGLNARARGPVATPVVITEMPIPQPAVHISPVEGEPEMMITVTGEGWQPGEQVSIYLQSPSDGGARVFVAASTVEDDGSFTATFLFPPDPGLAGVPYVAVMIQSSLTGAEMMDVLIVKDTDQPPLPTPTATLQLTPAQPVVPPEPTPLPTLTLEPTESRPLPTSIIPTGCVDKASFVSDVTVPDNTYVSPGQSFVKTWRLRNAGTCTWTADYTLVFAGGHNMGGTGSVPLRGPVAPGGTVDLSVTLTAPAGNGTYEGKWQLRNADGKLFGTGSNASGVFWTRIIVGPTPTPVPTPTNWRGEYYPNRYLTGNPVLVRDDRTINFDWGTSSPATAVPANGFSVRWARTLSFGGGTYRFYVHSDDGVRIWLDNKAIVDQWHDASGTTYSIDQALNAGNHTIRVEYYENGGTAKIQFWWEQVSASSQWRGEYFSNVTLAGTPAMTRNDATVDFNWGRNAPAAGLPVDGFSARWTRVLGFEEGLYRFHAIVDDGVRLYVDNVLVIDAWQDGGRREIVGGRALTAANHSVRVEYYERNGEALIQVWWEKVSAYPDWKGEYWSNRNLSGSPAIVRNDAVIDFGWGTGAPATGLPSDDFSARWTRTANFDAATYRFRVLVDDGVRLWVDDQLILDAWRDGAVRELTVDHALTRGTHRLRVEYYERTGESRIRVRWEKTTASFPDWKGEYWSNRRLDGSPALVRNDGTIDFRWGAGAPVAGLPADDFSVRWSRKVEFRPGVYRLQAWADDGIRVYVDGKLVLDEWHASNGNETYVADVALNGQRQMVVEYYERSGDASVKFWWRRIGDLPTPTLTPTPTPTPTPTVPPVNRPPMAVDDSVITDEDTRVYINVLANDSDPDRDALTVSGYGGTSTRGGTVSCTGAGICAYTPPTNFNGSDTFDYTISDGKGHNDTGTVTVLVNPVNDPPVAVDDSVTTHKNVPVNLNVLTNDTDPDGDSLVVSNYDTTSAQGGTVQCAGDGGCAYNPPVNFVGSDSFGYTASDGKGGTDAGAVAVMVYPENAPPAAVDDSATTDQNVPVEIDVLANDTDPDGDPLVISGYDASSAEGGTVYCVVSGVCTYAPPLNFSGEDTFGYTINDGNGGTSFATVTVMVNSRLNRLE